MFKVLLQRISNNMCSSHPDILGNIKIGRSAKIGSGSVVIKSIPDFVTAVGNPAKIVGNSNEKSAAKEMDLALAHVISPCGAAFNRCTPLPRVSFLLEIIFL